jgi:hypothetical protein
MNAPAMTLDGAPTQISADDVATLRASLRGALLQPSDDGYDAARRVWNGNIDRRPALVARCAGVSDVQRVVCSRTSATSSCRFEAVVTGHRATARTTAAWCSTFQA